MDLINLLQKTFPIRKIFDGIETCDFVNLSHKTEASVSLCWVFRLVFSSSFMFASISSALDSLLNGFFDALSAFYGVLHLRQCIHFYRYDINVEKYKA